MYHEPQLTTFYQAISVTSASSLPRDRGYPSQPQLPCCRGGAMSDGITLQTLHIQEQNMYQLSATCVLFSLSDKVTDEVQWPVCFQLALWSQQAKPILSYLKPTPGSSRALHQQGGVTSLFRSSQVVPVQLHLNPVWCPRR